MHFFIFTEELINSFHATCLFLYPLKTSENLWFSDVPREYKKRPMAWNGLTIITYTFRGSITFLVQVNEVELPYKSSSIIRQLKFPLPDFWHRWEKFDKS